MMVALKPLLLGMAVTLPLPLLLLSAPSAGAEVSFVRTATRAAELGGGSSLSINRLPGRFPELQLGQRRLEDTAARLRQSEIVVRDRCIQRPLFDQTLTFDCESVVLPANIGGGAFDDIPEVGDTNLKRLDAGTLLESVPLHSASDSPDPLGLGVQLRL